MQLHRLISSVDHVVEHPAVWTHRLSRSKWSDQIPHLEHQADGTDAWMIDGRKVLLSEGAQVGALMDDRVDSPKRWEDMPEATYAPAARLKAMDKDGVDYSVLYPTFAGFSGENLGAISDPDLALACVQAYNDWLLEDWASFSDRFIPLCVLPLSPIDAGVRELERSIKRGYRGAVFPAVPMHVRQVSHINSPEYDALWARFQELNVPLCFHAGSSRKLQYPIAPNYRSELVAAMQAVTRPASAVFDLVNFLFSRILLRFPRLQVVFAESTIGWGTFILEYADHQYEQDHCDYELKPSEMFKRQCYLTAWYDSVAVEGRYVGLDNILWATNFPTANSTWPDTRTFISKCLAGVSDYERDQILWGNAAKLYNVEGTKPVARTNVSLGRV
jgi:uncharacterized protein